MENNNIKMTDYFTTTSKLKKRAKLYLQTMKCEDFIQKTFAQNLVILLNIILEDLVADCLKTTGKDGKDGTYKMQVVNLKNTIMENEKYNFAILSMKKYNKSVQYADLVFFGFNNVIEMLETKFGVKLMIETECKNMLAFVISTLQYEFIDLAIKVLRFSEKKTMTENLLEFVYRYKLEDDFANKIKLRLDSMTVVDEVSDEPSTELTNQNENVDETKQTEQVETKQIETKQTEQVEEPVVDEPVEVPKKVIKKVVVKQVIKKKTENVVNA